MSGDYCEQIRIAAMAMEDGELPRIDREAVTEHLLCCPNCRDAVDSLDSRSLLPMDLERVNWPSQIRAPGPEIAEPAVKHRLMSRQRTWWALAVSISALIAVAAGAWVFFHSPTGTPRPTLVKDNTGGESPGNDQSQDDSPENPGRFKVDPPRAVLKLTYRRVSMQPKAPTEYERFAVNGKTKVHVAKPDPKTKTPCRITVLEKVGAEWRKLWTAVAVNPVQPAKASVSDDGKCVVTIGNAGGGPDHTKEQLVVYRDGKLKGRYTLEEMLQGHATADSIPRVTICPGGWWRESSDFIDNQQLCLFVDFAREWVLVDFQRAALVNVTDSDRARCEKRAREEIYKTLNGRNSGNRYSTYRRLIRFLSARDRTLFERLLTQPNSQGLPSGYSDEYYTTSNRERDLAEIALQAIDAGKKDALGNSSRPPFSQQIEYKRLGSLKIAATFPLPVTSGDGIVVLWLEPVIGHKEDARPANAIGIDLAYQFPSKLKSAGKPLNSPVTFYFYGVAPGQYRVRGYWDRKTRFKHLIERNYWQRTGQATIASDINIDVQIGKTTTADVAFE